MPVGVEPAPHPLRGLRRSTSAAAVQVRGRRRRAPPSSSSSSAPRSVPTSTTNRWPPVEQLGQGRGRTARPGPAPAGARCPSRRRSRCRPGPSRRRRRRTRPRGARRSGRRRNRARSAPCRGCRGAEVARTHAEQGVRRPGLVVAPRRPRRPVAPSKPLAVRGPPAAPQQLVGGEEHRLRRLGARREPEQRLVVAAPQPVARGVLLVAPAAGQLVDAADRGVDDGAARTVGPITV